MNRTTFDDRLTILIDREKKEFSLKLDDKKFTRLNIHDRAKQLKDLFEEMENIMFESKFNWKEVCVKNDGGWSGNQTFLDFSADARMEKVGGKFTGFFDVGSTRISALELYKTQEEFEVWLQTTMDKFSEEK